MNCAARLVRGFKASVLPDAATPLRYRLANNSLPVVQMPDDKTHSLREKPGMSASKLADYMAASEQARRSILRGCKFRPIARIVQHQAAKESIADSLSRPDFDQSLLDAKIDALRSGLQASDFDNEVAEHNADYIERFLETRPELPARASEVGKAGKMTPLDVDGFSLSFNPDLVLRRINRRNTPKMGVVFFRYGKNKPISDEVGCWQSAISFGYLDTKLKQGLSEIDPEKELCATLDMWSGKCHPAPGNSIYRFNEIKAACAGIVERWEQIAPPENAVF